MLSGMMRIRRQKAWSVCRDQTTVKGGFRFVDLTT
jgi:hypothetical protein